MHWIDQVMICSMQGIKHLVFDLGPNLRRVFRFRYIPRIENEGLTERAIILCKLNKRGRNRVFKPFLIFLCYNSLVALST